MSVPYSSIYQYPTNYELLYYYLNQIIKIISFGHKKLKFII